MFYLVLTEDNQTFVTPCPKRVKESIATQAVLCPAAPLSVINELSNPIKCHSPLEKYGVLRLFTGLSNPLSYKERLLKKAIALYPEVGWYWEPKPQGLANSSQKLLEDFTLRTRGRLISPTDFQILAREMGGVLEDVICAAQIMVEEGRGQWIPALQRINHRWQCMRCGSLESNEWPSVYGQAVTCTECSALGALSSLDYLYQSIASQDIAMRDITFPQEFLHYQPSRKPTPAQEKGSLELIKFMEDKRERRLLVWAACGAGKTEVTFPALNWALQRGMKILFAAPRQDVIHDIAPRVQRDFPHIKLQLLTGSSPNRFEKGDLVLATTHQVLRFNQRFDLIILDEVDAFPYQGNRMLEWGMKKALKPEGKMIYLTATPSRRLREQAAMGEIHLIRIPARHHGYPLPLPEWQKNLGISHGIVDQFLIEELRTLIQAGPILIFVPTVKRVAFWVRGIQEALPDIPIAGSHSKDPERRQKLEGFFKQKIQILVSTSILERGVTLPGVQVMVLEADHDIYDEKALVQMAGRSGRTTECPSGKVIFLSGRQTSPIREAIEWIIEQNRLAKTQGLIRD